MFGGRRSGQGGARVRFQAVRKVKSEAAAQQTSGASGEDLRPDGPSLPARSAVEGDHPAQPRLLVVCEGGW